MPKFARFMDCGGKLFGVDRERVITFFPRTVHRADDPPMELIVLTLDAPGVTGAGSSAQVELDPRHTFDEVQQILEDGSAPPPRDRPAVSCQTCGDRMPHGPVGRSGQCTACVIAEADARATVERMKVQEELARADEEAPLPEFARHPAGWDVVTCEGCGGLAQQHAVTKRLCPACVEARKPGPQRVEVSPDRCPKVWALVERIVHATGRDVDRLVQELPDAWEDEVGPIPDLEG